MDISDSKELSRVELGGEMELRVRSSGVGPAELLLPDEDRPNESTRNENRLITHGVHRGRVRELPTEKRSDHLSVARRNGNL